MHPDGPYVLFFHDRDISLEHDFVERTFDVLPKGIRTISMNNYVGILHARIESLPDGFGFVFHYDEPYCSYFAIHSSSWRLLTADSLLAKLGQKEDVSIVVDEHVARRFKSSELLSQSALIQIPAGIGKHMWRLMIQ